MNGINEHVTIAEEFGVLYANGTVDWNTRSWFGSIETPELRRQFREQYALRMQGVGAVEAEVQFITRTMVHACTPYTVIVDDAPEPPAEVPAPPAEDNPPAAPGEGDEPPTDEPPVEEESPVDPEGDDAPATIDPPIADDEGEPEHGG